MKGQKSRAGAGIKLGFRGGDNRLWQLFPKQRGASKRPGNSRPHRKHRFFQFRGTRTAAVNVRDLGIFAEGSVITPREFVERGLIPRDDAGVKVLGDGDIKKRLQFQGVTFSKTAREKIEKAGGTIA